VLLRIDTIALQRCRQLGLAGSAILVIGGVFAGVPPARDPVLRAPVFEQLRALTTPAVMCAYVGVSMLLLAWWRLGRLVRRRDAPTTRDLLTTMAWWGAPLLVTMPIFSRDVYSYLAQGTMTVLGIDAYQYGPAALGGPLFLDIPSIWHSTPAPYGPVFLSMAGDVTGITGESTWLGILGMRVLALGGLALLIVSVPRIARSAGVDPGAALWLGLLNPMVLIHLVADAHNDALMLGLMMAGLALALERRPAAGVALVALAALVKAPAALALVFLVPIWASQLSGATRWLRAALAAGGVGAATVVVTTTVAGMGYGWIGALDTPMLAHTWTSITTDLGYWTGVAAEKMGLATGAQMLAAWRMAGLAAAGVICLVLLRRYHRHEPVVGLGLGLAAVLALAPVVHPWYLLWAIIPLAAAARSARVRRAVVVTSIVMTVMVLPGGVQPSFDVFLGAALGAGLVFGIAWAARNVDWERALASALAAGRQMMQSEPVAVDAKAADDAGGHRGHDGMVPERLARVNVGDVHLDQGGGQQGAGVADGVGVVRPGAGVEHDRRVFVRSLVEPVEQHVLSVGLTDLDREAQFLADSRARVGQIGIRGQTVDVGLTRAETAKIRPVQYIYLHDETSR